MNRRLGALLAHQGIEDPGTDPPIPQEYLSDALACLKADRKDAVPAVQVLNAAIGML